MTEMPERCVGYSSVARDHQCEATPKLRVHQAKYGAPGEIVTCGRHLSWAITVWLRKPGCTVHEIELIEEMN